MTEAEHKLWRALRMRQINDFRFRRQFPIGRYIADFVCLKARLIVEVDGGQHDEQRSYDANRDRWLNSQGFAVLRFWNNEVLDNLEGVTEKIAEVLRTSAPPSQPSPVEGEGAKA